MRTYNEIERPDFTPDMISELKADEVFVFGSNLEGMHGGGAAFAAWKKFGAVMGCGVGLRGQSYAIPTMQGGVETIEPYVTSFIAFAKEHPELFFYVTRIGCGIAGFRDKEIAPLFSEAVALENVCLMRKTLCFVLKNAPLLVSSLLKNAARRVHPGGRRIVHLDSALPYLDYIVSWRPVPEGIADRPGSHKVYPFNDGIIVLVGVTGKDHIHALFLEKREILLPLLHGEVEVVLFLVQALPDDGAMEEHEGVPASLRRIQLPDEPVPLLRLGLRHAILDAVGVHPDEGTAPVPEGETVISPERDVGLLFLARESHVVMVPRDRIDGRFNLREPCPIHGILHGVGGVIHEVPRHKDIGG